LTWHFAAASISRLNRGDVTRKVLVVDDDALVRAAILRDFTHQRVDARGADGLGSALELCRLWQPEAAVIDLDLSGNGDGIGVMRELLREHPMKAVIMTSFGSIGSAVDAIQSGAVGYCCKPIAARSLLDVLAGTRPSGDFAAMTLEQAKWEHIQRALTASQGNISESARMLGIRRQSLQRMLHKSPPRHVR
jgi:two-component system response regulator RegA